jgi:hypothetical protein
MIADYAESAFIRVNLWLTFCLTFLLTSINETLLQVLVDILSGWHL